jgi:hypothetical protein
LKLFDFLPVFFEPPSITARARIIINGGIWFYSGFDLVFNAIAFAFDPDGIRVMYHPVEDGGGECTVVVEYLRPLLKRSVCRNNY